tara:strand:- start:110 stop:475 length:366 start_codon:yes stop_codon:yes gene_type:complete
MVNELKNTKNDQEKRPRGRPKGTAPSFSSVILVRNSIKAAIDECERRGFPLYMLLAEEMIESKTPSKSLNLLGKFLPGVSADLNITVENNFASALKEVQQRLVDAGEVVDVEVIEHDEHDM